MNREHPELLRLLPPVGRTEGRPVGWRAVQRPYRWLAVALAGAGCLVAARVKADSPPPTLKDYEVIIQKDPFHLKPPAPPPSHETAAPPTATAPPNIVLTGIALFDGTKHAYLEVHDLGAKNGAPKYYSMRENESQDHITILHIDDKKRVVEVMNHGYKSWLHFATNAASRATLASAHRPTNRLPAGLLRRRRQPPHGAPTISAPAGPTVIGRGGTDLSPTVAQPPATARAAAPTINNRRYIGSRALQTIPPRQMRTTQPQPAINGEEAVARQVIVDQIQRATSNIPLPPLPIQLPGAGNNAPATPGHP